MTPPERLQDVTLAERLLDLMASDRTGKAYEFQPDLQVVPVAAVRDLLKSAAPPAESRPVVDDAAVERALAASAGGYLMRDLLAAGDHWSREVMRAAIVAAGMTPTPAESQPQGGEAVGECFCDRAGLGVRGVSCGDCPRDYTTHAVQIAAPGDVERLQRAYWLGWRNSAAWADRNDLWADRDSKAYTQERDDDLGSLAAALRSQGQADAVGDSMIDRALDARLPNGDRVYSQLITPFARTTMRAALTAALAQQANKEQPPNTELSRPA